MLLSPSRILLALAAASMFGGLVPEITAQSRYLRLDGRNSQFTYGWNATPTEDLNADGIRDILVGIRNGAEVRVHSGRDGELLFAVPGGTNLKYYGWSVLSPGDLDGDGVADLVVGDPYIGFNGGVTMISSKQRKITRVLVGEQGSRMGWSLATLPDLDQDGVPEVVVGAPEQVSKTLGTNGVVHILSGKTFKIIRSHWPTKSTGRGFGESISVGGDVDADGFPDLAIGDPRHDNQYGAVRIVSGKSGKLIRTIAGTTTARTWFGRGVAWIGDQDGDKVDDLLVTTELSGTTKVGGLVHIVSGKSGKILWTISDKEEYGVNAASAGDIDGDGVEDILVGAPNQKKTGTKYFGLAVLYSGKTRKPLFALEAAADLLSVGYAVGGNWDLDQDGKPEFWIGALSAGLKGEGSLRFFTAQQRSLQADRNLLSISAGGSQTLSIDAGVANARRLYVVLGSITGTKPGIKIGSLLLPLNQDPYLTFTMTAPNNVPLLSGVSFLDAQGRGKATFHIPPGTPAKFNGLGFDHAFLVLDFVKGTVTFASNAVPARLID